MTRCATHTWAGIEALPDMNPVVLAIVENKFPHLPNRDIKPL